MLFFDSKVPVRTRIALFFMSNEIRATYRELSKARLDHPESDFLKSIAIAMVKKNPQRVTAFGNNYQPRAIAVFVLIDAILDLAKALRAKHEQDKLVQGLLEIDGLNLIKLAHSCARYLHTNNLVSLDEYRKLSSGIHAEL